MLCMEFCLKIIIQHFIVLWNKNCILFNFVLLSCFATETQKSEATFFGSEYIFYDFMAQRTDHISSQSDRVDFYFRTEQHSGFLFYTGRYWFIPSQHNEAHPNVTSNVWCLTGLESCPPGITNKAHLVTTIELC